MSPQRQALKSSARLCGLALAALTGLVACEAAGTLAGGGRQSDYLVARQALETGNYDLAIRRYGTLIGAVEAGTAARLQLEYAHALLRGSRYDDAIRAADPLVATAQGAIRASALAVRGTARHEAARAQMAAGAVTAATGDLLAAAAADLAEFLAGHAALDSAGSMRARLALIAADQQALS